MKDGDFPPNQLKALFAETNKVTALTVPSLQGNFNDGFSMRA
jgi:hypothetical protein